MDTSYGTVMMLRSSFVVRGEESVSVCVDGFSHQFWGADACIAEHVKYRERRLYNLLVIHVRGPLHLNTSKSSLTRHISILLHYHSPRDHPRSSNTFVLARQGRILTRKPP